MCAKSSSNFKKYFLHLFLFMCGHARLGERTLWVLKVKLGLIGLAALPTEPSCWPRFWVFFFNAQLYVITTQMLKEYKF